MDRAFIKGPTIKNIWNYLFDVHLAQAIVSVCNYKLGHNILYGCQVSSSERIWGFFCFFLDKIYIKSVTLKLKGQISRHFGRFTLWLRSSTCTLKVWQSCLVESCTTRDLVWWENTSPNSDILAKLYGLQTRKVTCSYIDTHWVAHGTTSPKHVVSNPRQNPTCLEHKCIPTLEGIVFFLFCFISLLTIYLNT